MTEVAVKGNLDGALKRFKQKCSRDGIPSEVKKRKFYDKPGKEEEEKKRKKTLEIHKRKIEEIINN